MTEITKELLETVNKPGRIGILGTADSQGQPNVAYFGSPRLMENGTLVMGLGSNRSLKNLEQNPKAVFLAIAESPVTFTTAGYRLYLNVRELRKEGPLLDGIRGKIAQLAGSDAAKMIQAAVVFEVTEIRQLLAME